MTLFDPDASAVGDRDFDYEVIEVSSDGGSRGNPGPSAVGAVVVDPATGALLAEVSECIGATTNNVAEYRALLAGLAAAARFRARRLVVRADSKLLIEQLKGNYKVKHANLKPLASEAHRLLSAWTSVELRHVPREQNTAADALVNRALDEQLHPRSPAARAPGAERFVPALAEMFFWYLGGAVFAIWNVFQTNGLDVRLLVGGLAPVIVDAPFGAMRYGHTLLVPVLLLAAVMLATTGRGKRLLRRRLLSLPIGWLAGLALSGAFTHAHVFWWPAFGTDFANVALFPPLGWIVLLELLGLAALRWCWVRFGLRNRARRIELVRHGHVVTT